MLVKNKNKKTFWVWIYALLSQLKRYSFGWRFIFLFILVFSLLAGTDVLSFLFKAIRAENNQTKTINFYVESIEVLDRTADVGSGWWQEDNALINPELGPEAETTEFDDTNSLFYSGGNYSVVLKDFALLQVEEEAVLVEDKSYDSSMLVWDESKLEESSNEIDVASGTEDYAFGSSLDDVSSSFGDWFDSDDEVGTSVEAMLEMIENKYSTTTEGEVIDVSDSEGQGDIEYEVVDETFVGEVESTVETFDLDLESKEESVVEIVDEIEMVVEAEIEVLVEEELDLAIPDLESREGELAIPEVFEQMESDSEVEEEISFFENIFMTTPALAEEYLTEPVEDVRDLGEFLGAKLKFSMAIRRKSVDVSEGVSDEMSVGAKKESQEAVTENDGPGLIGGLINKIISGNGIEVIDIENEVEVEVSNVESVTEELTNEIDQTREIIDDVSLLERFVKQAKAQSGNAKLNVWQALGEVDENSSSELWQKLDSISENEMNNFSNKGYYSINLDTVTSWDDLEKLQIKLEGVVEEYEDWLVYIDSAWVEVEYNEETSLEKLEKRQRWEEALQMISEQMDFRVNEKGEIRFVYTKNETFFGGLADIMGLCSFWQGVDIRAVIVDKSDRELDLPLTMIFEDDGEFVVRLPELPRDFSPGKYKIKFIIEDTSSGELEVFEINQDFSWGVLALNINKSIYTPLEEAYLQMAVLDDFGHTICSADLTLEVTGPMGAKVLFSTNDNTIVSNPLCGANNVIDSPDYYVFYDIAGSGIYELKLTAVTDNGIKEITDRFEVRDELSFDVERIGPSRIYPLADYTMRIAVLANEDFHGDIVEVVPESFQIVGNEYQILNNDSITLDSLSLIQNKDGEKNLILKNINLKEGDILELSYTFDAPDVSPEFYLLGPATFYGASFEVTGSADFIRGDVVFEEARQWQVASDAVSIPEATNGTQIGWTNSTNAWDSTNDTWASRDILKKTGPASPESTLYLEASTNNAADLGGDITQVEIGIEGAVENTSVSAYVMPRFDSSTNGTPQVIAGTTLGTSNGTYDSGVIHYVDITNDSARPNYPMAWTWAEIQNLDIRVYGSNTSNSIDRFLYIDQVYIRVNYDANNLPTGTIISAGMRQDGSGVVDVTIQADDADDDNLRARIDYVAGVDCDFGSPLDPTLDVTGITATSSSTVDPEIDNDYPYQVGTSTGWINTSEGINTVSFDWLTKSDIDNLDGTYCLQLTVNDQEDDGALVSTTTVFIDNKAPTQPGSLSEWGTTTRDTVALAFGATSTDSNFYEYKIFYATSTPVDETDYVHSSSTDINLASATFNDEATTSISGLEEGETYYFAIWAYDKYGFVSSSSAVSVTTNWAPFSKFNSAVQRDDGTGIVDIEVDIDDLNNDNSIAKIEYVAGADCNFSFPLRPLLDETQGNIGSTYGLLKIENDNDYQLGSALGWITTPATNTIAFDWFAKSDEDLADDTYCLRLTVNDQADDQNLFATTTFTLDNLAPTDPGDLSADSVSTSSIVLAFGATTTETNFSEYKIFYKQASSGVTEEDDPLLDGNLGDIEFNDEATTSVSGLLPNTDYVFNIFAYDLFGNIASATEVMIHTDALVSNVSLTLTNPETANYVIAEGETEWNFRAVVSEESGWSVLDEVVLRLENENDEVSPFTDLEFTWSQTSDSFSETGTDALDAVALSVNSSSDCTGITCTLDFKLIFNYNFSTSSHNYSAELSSTNDGAITDNDGYGDIYQVKRIKVEQLHYLWRNDDGGE